MAAFLLLAATPSGQTQQCATTKPSFAKLFTYEDMGSYQKVTSKQCTGEPPYILYPRGQTAPDLGPDYKYFGVPLEKVAVTQSVTLTFLEMLGVRDKIIVASEYASSACVAKKVADGDAQAMIQHRNDETAHAALMANGELDAIFSDPYYTGVWYHAPSASKVVCEASTYEETPLGNGEWIKVCPALCYARTASRTAHLSRTPIALEPCARLLQITSSRYPRFTVLRLPLRQEGRGGRGLLRNGLEV